MDTTLQELCEQIKSAAATGQTLTIQGSGSKLFYGNSIAATCKPLYTSNHSGIVNYEPSELVLTAKAGTSLTEVEQLLSANGQMLAFEPPHFGADTLGGCIASGLAGPRRIQAGPVADFVLGTQIISAKAELLNFGGEVMKNVAGYDLSRLMAGSLGALALVTQVSLKVLPKPYYEQTVCLELDEAAALEHCLGWFSRPLPISATAWLRADTGQGYLYVRLSGNDSAVQSALKIIGGQSLTVEQADSFWLAIRDQKHGFFNAGPLWRLSLPLGLGPLGLGPSLHECNGAVRWLSGSYDAPTIRAQVAKLGGSVCLFKRAGLAADIASFNKLSAPVLKIHQRLRQEFDPNGVFDFNRLIMQS